MIPFVQALGDELERAIAARRSRVRRRIAGGAIAFAIAATGVAGASGVFTGTAEELAATSVGCVEGGGVSVVSVGDGTPVEACRETGMTGPLVACADGPQVVVVSGRSCGARGLQPIPAGYAAARAKVVAFHRAVAALEASACIPPAEFADRVQRLLDDGGWTGWRTEVRPDLATGPCGTVTTMGGNGERTIEGTLDPRERRVLILAEPPRALMDLLYGPDGIAAPAMDATGERCHTVGGAKELARRRLAAADRPLAFTVGSKPPETDITGPRGDRLDEGCAIIVGVATEDDGLLVEIWR